jgi:hypothetical protein
MHFDILDILLLAPPFAEVVPAPSAMGADDDDGWRRRYHEQKRRRKRHEEEELILALVLAE